MRHALVVVAKYVGAAVGGALTLLIATSLAFRLGVTTPHLWVSTIGAAVVFAAGQLLVGRRLLKVKVSPSAAVLTALAVVIGAPLWIAEHHRGGRAAIPVADGALGPKDIVIVSPPHANAPGRPQAIPDAALPLRARDDTARFTVATNDPGRGVRIAAVGLQRDVAAGLAGGAPGNRHVPFVWRHTGGRYAVLDVANTAGTAGVGIARTTDWTAAIDELKGQNARVYVLLPAGTGRIRQWRRLLKKEGATGDAVGLDQLDGGTLPDEAVEVVTQGPKARQYALLAQQYRPLLFFDHDERFNVPVDVDAMFGSGKVQMCRHELTDDGCVPVADGTSLDESYDRLRLPAAPPRARPGATPAPGSTAVGTYYYAIHTPPGSPLVYLDYWWYLPSNPEPVLPSVLCGPGFSLPEKTCFRHDSDWEGVAVVVRPGQDAPVQVGYAQHDGEAIYGWSDLVRHWGRKRVRGMHPLVFVARNSHAAYPTTCSGSCKQVGKILPDGAHDGFSEWAGNSDDLCLSACLQALPRTRDGAAATWNAFPGLWGTQNCILDGAVCDRSPAPRSPSFQKRYIDPAEAGTMRRLG